MGTIPEPQQSLTRNPDFLTVEDRRAAYGRCPDAVTFNPDISHVAVRLYLVLDRYSTMRDGARPSRATLAEHLDVSAETIRRASRELVTAGVLAIQKRTTDSGADRPNHYVLQDPAPTLLEPGGRGTHTRGGRGTHTSPHEGHTHEGGEKESTSPNGEVSNKPVESKATRSPKSNPPWDAIVSVLTWSPTTRGANQRIGKALRELKQAMPEETDERLAKHIEARARRYRETWPTSELTPESLVKHWDRFAPGARIPPSPVPTPQYANERGTLTRAEWLLEHKHPGDMTVEERTVCLQGLDEDGRLLFDSRLHQPRVG